MSNDTNPTEIAQARRLHAELAESLGNSMPDTLPDQIAASLQQRPQSRTAARPQNGRDNAAHPARSIRSSRPAWLVAAALLLGTLVVVMVAKDREEQTSTPRQAANHSGELVTDAKTQDPQPQKQDATAPRVAKLTTASVYVETREQPDPGDAVTRLFEIAKVDRINLVIAGSIRGESKIDLLGSNSSEAIERIAAELKVNLTEQRGVLIVGGIGQSGRKGQRVTLKCDAIPVREFIARMHKQTGINFLVADDIAGKVQCDVVNAAWRSVIDEACRELRVELVGCGTVLALRRKAEAKQVREVTIHMKQQPAKSIMDTWAHPAKANLVTDAELHDALNDELSVTSHGLAANAFLLAMAEALHATATTTTRGITRLKPSPPHWSTDLIMERVPMRQALELNGSPATIELPKSNATVSVFLKGASGRHVIDAILTTFRLTPK